MVFDGPPLLSRGKTTEEMRAEKKRQQQQEEEEEEYRRLIEEWVLGLKMKKTEEGEVPPNIKEIIAWTRKLQGPVPTSSLIGQLISSIPPSGGVIRAGSKYGELWVEVRWFPPHAPWVALFKTEWEPPYPIWTAHTYSLIPPQPAYNLVVAEWERLEKTLFSILKPVEESVVIVVSRPAVD